MCKKIRTIAMYLPQYHRVKENDGWWGDGFTEWVAVKQAKPQFVGHKQPVKPLNNNYYDLQNKETFIWQAALAKEYGVDGFAFYHYWFRDGRQILEKPAENLLKWKDIDMPFCFCWATATWARTWSNIPGKNSWADKFENKVANKNSGVLLEQKFGDQSEWKTHFDYLLPFFEDRRYICKDGRPVFIFDVTGGMPCLERMIMYWKKLAQEYGLTGIYIIVMNVPFVSPLVADAIIRTIPYVSMDTPVDSSSSLEWVSYDDSWNSLLNMYPTKDITNLWWGITNYDDTPRRGANGKIMWGATSKKFRSYYTKLLEKSAAEDAPFVFINAWNEWGEGMHLEPDEVDGYGYLEAIREGKSSLKKLDSNVELTDSKEDWINLKRELLIQKLNYDFLLNWVRLIEGNHKLKTYFEAKGYQRVAIYGYGTHGKMLYKKLKNENYSPVYVVDRKKIHITDNIPVYDLDDKLPTCDAVVVSVVSLYAEIAMSVQKKIDVPIISLAEVVSECL